MQTERERGRWGVADVAGSSGGFQRLCVAIGAGLLALAAGCSSPEAPSVGKVGRALTAAQQAVLGFESPTTDWTASSGSVAASNNVTQGSQALALTAWGWTELVSAPLSSLGQTNDTLRLDVSLPQTVSWGEVRVILVAPSVGLWWSDLGGQSLAGRAAGEYATLSFPLSSELRTALAGDYGDLRVRIVLNAPGSSSPYLFDNLVVASSSPDAPPEPEVTTLSVVIPSTHERSAMVLSASEQLRIDERAEIGSAGTLTNVAGLGASGAEPLTIHGTSL